jgi:hypothetical protein
VKKVPRLNRSNKSLKELMANYWDAYLEMEPKLSEEDKTEHKYWADLWYDHKNMSHDYVPQRTLDNMNRVSFPLGDKRKLVLFEVKLLIAMEAIELDEGIRILKMCKSQDEENMYLVYVILKQFSESRWHQYGRAAVNEKHRSQIYNDLAKIYMLDLSKLLNLTK